MSKWYTDEENETPLAGIGFIVAIVCLILFVTDISYNTPSIATVFFGIGLGLGLCFVAVVLLDNLMDKS